MEERIHPSTYPIHVETTVYSEFAPDHQYPLHEHDFWQMFMLVHGGTRHVVEGRMLELNPMQALLIKPGAVRERLTLNRGAGYVQVLFENVRLDLERVTHCVLDIPESLGSDLTALIDSICAPRSPFASEVQQVLCCRLLLDLVERASRRSDVDRGYQSPLNARRRRELVERVDAFLRTNLQRSILVADMAAAVSMSPRHFARVFGHAAGMTPGRRLTDLRLARAKALLLSSSAPITSIADEVGFSSFSHFTRLFKRRIGHSPSDYRRMQGRTVRSRTMPKPRMVSGKHRSGSDGR